MLAEPSLSTTSNNVVDSKCRRTTVAVTVSTTALILAPLLMPMANIALGVPMASLRRATTTLTAPSVPRAILAVPTIAQHHMLAITVPSASLVTF
jgi:hypothetical protein